MDEAAFQNEKRRILNAHEQWTVFKRIKAKIDIDCKRPGHHTQCPFSFNEADKACVEWGWPNDDAHQDLTLKVVMEYLQKYLGWKFRIKNTVEANLLKDHHGIGVRIDDLKESKQWSGTLNKHYDVLFMKGEKAPEHKAPATQQQTSPRKEEKKEPKKKDKDDDDGEGVKKSKSWKEKLGLQKKDKDDGGGSSGKSGGSASGGSSSGKSSNFGSGKGKDDGDDYFH